MAAQLAFAYSALRFAEAYGLWKERTWAEWLSFVSGTLFLPLEIREILRGVTFFRSAVFVVNLGIVLYMFYLLREGRQRRRELGSIEPENPDQSRSQSEDQRGK